MKNCTQQEWIDRYLLCQLEGDELQQFEMKYDTDESFRAEVDLQAEIMVAVNSYCAAQPEINMPKPAPKLVWIRRHWAKAAAIIIFLIVAKTTFQSDIIQSTGNNNIAKHNSSFIEDKAETFHANSIAVAMQDILSESGVPVLASTKTSKKSDSDGINSRGREIYM